MVVASRVDPAALPDDLGAASIFQEVITGLSVRVTVIGDEMFAVQIDGNDELDWRPAQDQLSFTSIAVPDAVRAGIEAFMAFYRLEYSALDFIIDSRTGTWVFLENNPSGMYGFVEIQTGLEITAAIAKRLCQPLGLAFSNSHKVAS